MLMLDHGTLLSV